MANIATVLEAQNIVMMENNNLVAQQVEILRNTSILKGNDDSAIEKLKEIEEKKLKLSVKPNLWLNGAGYDGFNGELRIDLNNKGEDAKLLNFNLTSDDIVLHSLFLPCDLDKGERRYIFGRQKGKTHIKDSNYEIDVIYQDRLENKYLSKLKGTGANVRIIETRDLKK